MSELARIDAKLEYMEASLHRMEDAVTRGMDKIGEAMTDMAVVMSRINENGEQHRIIHERIDDNKETTEALKEEFIALKTNYNNCCGTPKPENPVRTALIVALVVMIGTSYIALLGMHWNDLAKIIFH